MSGAMSMVQGLIQLSSLVDCFSIDAFFLYLDLILITEGHVMFVFLS